MVTITCITTMNHYQTVLFNFFYFFEHLYMQITIIQFKVPYQLTQRLKKKAKYLIGTCT